MIQNGMTKPCEKGYFETHEKYTWLKAVRAGKLDIGEGSHTLTSAMSLAEEITMLRKRVKEQDKEIRRLKEENEFLEEDSAFFAATQRFFY